MDCLFGCVRFDGSVKRTAKLTGLGCDDSSTVKSYGWEEVEAVTSNFARMIGSGGYSSVYAARLSGSDMAALKVHFGSHRLYQIFKAELDVLLRLHHPHIVKLLGYFDDSEENGALLLEYLPQGNLQEKLRHDGKETLPWKNRAAIALQLAQAIEHMHEQCSPQIVHGDIKSSNILLDQNLNSKLCDFGSAKVGFSSMVPPPTMSPRSKHVMVTGSPGYTDPHYFRTGIPSKKMDMYGFGVVILELISGKEAFCGERGEMLVRKAEPLIREILDLGSDIDEDKVREFMDPRLLRDSRVEIEETKVMLSVAASCLRTPPSLRPSASQVVKILDQELQSLSLHGSCGKK